MGHVPQRVGHDGCPVGSRANLSRSPRSTGLRASDAEGAVARRWGSSSHGGLVIAWMELFWRMCAGAGGVARFISRWCVRNLFACIRCGDRRRLTSPTRTSRIEIEIPKSQASSTLWLPQREATARADQGGAPTRIALRPHDPTNGEEIEQSRVVKGYEYDRGQFVTFSAEELKALDVESSKVIDLETLRAARRHRAHQF
jgi:hypothetical protein